MPKLSDTEQTAVMLSQAQPSKSQPAVLEITGLSGAGKTTLAEGLPSILAQSGCRAFHSKTAPLARYSMVEKIAAALFAIGDIVRLSRFFFKPLLFSGPQFNVISLRRLLKTFRHAFSRRAFMLERSNDALVVQEPGWPAVLLSQYLYAPEPLAFESALKFLRTAPRMDYLVTLIAEPTVSIERMGGRGRGIPSGLRRLSDVELRASLGRANATSLVLDQAARRLGIATLMLDVSAMSAEEVASSVAEFVLTARSACNLADAVDMS